mmetsp:Transcript_32239/g.48638  ORF Transcript_32239/g.48638 Transcript_32239/m.48638 type:complete len:177 (+) Transcript_32239:139-669(+)
MKAVIFALSAMVLKASLSAALSPEEVDLTPELLEADDACAEGDEQCYVKLLQLKAEKKGAEDEEQHPNVAFFEELDSNNDAEIQRSEVDAMLAHRIDLEEGDVDKLFQDADEDQSGGLSMVEYEDALEKWSTSCATMHRSWFCSGRTRINCCRHGAVWSRCAGGSRTLGCGVRAFR